MTVQRRKRSRPGRPSAALRRYNRIPAHKCQDHARTIVVGGMESKVCDLCGHGWRV